MAFFKFRFPGQQPVVPADGEAAASATLEGVRRQARYRLLGSAVLVLVAVMVFPLIFDTQPRPVAVDTPIIVPDRHSAPPLSAGRLPPSQQPATPLKPDPEALAAALPTPEPALAAVPANAGASASAPAPVVTSPALAAPPAPAAVLPPGTGRGTASEPAGGKNAVPAAGREEAVRARALLEGNSVPAAPGADRHVLQVGAYTDPDKVREVRRKLEQAGLKTYTQAVEGRDGKRVVRVRIGPFDTKADADKAAARVRKLDLPVSVLRL